MNKKAIQNKIKQLEIDLKLAEDRQEKQAILISIQNLKVLLTK